MGASVSTGTGGSIGGPPTLSQRELETSAAAQVAKQMAGITADSLMQHFAQMGLDAKFKYKSAANNPSLAPLVKTRINATNPKDTDPAAWKEMLTRLVNYLPSDVRNELLRQAKLPPEERDPAYASLDKFLGNTATMMLWLDDSTQPLDAAQIANSHILQYQGLSDSIAASTIVQAKEMLSNLRDAMKEIGPNNPNFDDIMKLSSEVSEKLKDFEDLVASGNVDKEKMADLASSLKTLNDRVSALAIGDNMQILKPILSALTDISAIFSLNTDSGSLLFGLALALTGFSENESDAGPLSSALTKSLKSFSDGIINELFPDATEGEKKLFSDLSTTLFSAVVILSLFANENLSPLDIRLAFKLAADGGILDAIGSKLASIFGADDASKTVLGHVFAFAAALLIIKVAGEKHPGLQETMAKDVKDLLDNWLDSIQKLAESNKYFSVHADIAKRQLEEDLEREFLKTVESIEALASEESQHKTLVAEIKRFYEFLATLKHVAGHKDDLKSNDISLIVA